ncbi:hypothetical protein DFH29DRAFT_1008042 [Suillus ampliporus]|nr:hypothetical protein DFH29DRAFT_1008042 [Suillus ampliporus]
MTTLQCAKRAAMALKSAASISTIPVEVEPPLDPDISTVYPSTPATSPPAEEETASFPQPKSIPKPRPVKPTEKLAYKASSSTPALVFIPPPKAALAPVSDKGKKRKSEELDVDGDVDGDSDSSLSEVESVSDSPVVAKHGRKSRKKTTTATTKKRKGRK